MISILEDKVFIAVIVNGVWVDMVFGKIVSKFVNEHRSHSQKVPALGCML